MNLVRESMSNRKLTIAFGSDLHLSSRNEERCSRALAFPEGVDVIVLAGDIAESMYASFYTFELADQYPNAHIVWVAGNHEHYNSNIDEQIQRYREVCSDHSRVHFLENDSIEISGVTFLGCTLWTDFSILGEKKLAMEIAADGVRDFECIEVRAGDRFTPRDAADRFNESCGYLKQQLANCNPATTVVVTHFPPGYATRNLLFPADAITGYFQANIDHLIDQYQPALWVYGHNHYGNDLYRGRTRVVSNQLGYPSEEGYIPIYDASRIIVLDAGRREGDR